MTRPVIHLDFETQSAVDLKKAGVYRYAEDESTKLLCLSYRVDDGPVQRADHDYFCRPLDEDIREGGLILAHNAGFERTIWNALADHEIRLTPEMQSCTLARANALNLPASLDGIGEALDAPFKKDTGTHWLMLKACKTGYVFKPGEFEALQAYCDHDVRTECAVDAILPPLSPEEQALWVLDQKINDRGFAVDLDLIERAQRCVDAAKKAADKAISAVTDGAVTATSQTQRLVKWINDQGVPCESVAAGEREEIVTRCELFDAPHVLRALEIRQDASKAFKFKAALDCVCRDGRIRGTLVYNNALSGRWTGRLFQPHNMKRIETEDDERTVADALWILGQPMTAEGHLAALETLCGPPLEALSLLSRATIIAPPGRKLVGGDFSNIEGKINAWVNDEDWKIEAFRRGEDLYIAMAAGALYKPHEAINKADRQLWGKVPELACGYQGGVNAFHKMGANYGIRVDDRTARRVVTAWREQNPMIVKGWKDLQESAIQATLRPGLVVPCLHGNVQYVHRKGFLWCQVPGGGVIPYPGARLRRQHKIVIIDGDEVEFDNWGVVFPDPKRPGLLVDLYGGRQMAHVVSRTARDILAKAMHRVEDAGYELVLTVHDEVLSEVDEAFGSATDYQRIMEVREPWFDDLPVTAKAWQSNRYEH